MFSTLPRESDSSFRLATILLTALFGVLTHWNVWDNGVHSIGWNTSITWLALGLMLIRSNQSIRLSSDWMWLAPLGLMTLSFGLYENPWLKTLCFLVMPMAVGVFFSFGHLKRKEKQVWGSAVLSKLISNTFAVIPAIFPSLVLLRNAFFSSFEESKLCVLKRVVRALMILLPLMLVILLLLSSADENFDLMVSGWFEYVAGVLDWALVGKLISVCMMSGVLLAVVTILRRELGTEQEFVVRRVDDLVAIIVLTSILFVYIAFLIVQLDYLLVKQLPIEFADTEHLVKSGFWQLFFLSAINVGLFYWAYKNTGWLAQWILRVYLIASALILMSAGWRMGLYVVYYGLSYEKFFASYTTFYALVLFCFLGWAVFATSRKDIVKTLCVSALWMFSIATVLPIERIIFSSNLALSQKEGSRINLIHLSVLSTDVLAIASRNFHAGKLTNNGTWAYWLRATSNENCDRPWYESNLSVELNCSGISFDDLPPSNWKLY